VSGDGADQDDIAAFSTARSFQAPRLIRADRVRLRGVRLSPRRVSPPAEDAVRERAAAGLGLGRDRCRVDANE
jgi:hypothetical protein